MAKDAKPPPEEAPPPEEPPAQHIIQLPRTVVSQNYIALFGLKKQVYAGYPTSFTIRVEYVETVENPKSSNFLELNVKHVETGEFIPVTVQFDDACGDYVVQYHAPDHGTVAMSVDLRYKKFIPPPKPPSAEQKLPEIVDTPVNSRSFISRAMRVRMEKEEAKKKKEEEEAQAKRLANPDSVSPPTSPKGSSVRVKRKNSPKAPSSPSSPSRRMNFDVVTVPDGPDDKFEITKHSLFGGLQTIEVLSGVMKLVGPEGAVVKFFDVEIIVPEGTFEQETELSIHTKPCCSAIYKRGFNSVTLRSSTLTLTPFKQKFSQPVSIRMTYKDNSRYPRPSIGRLCFLWWRDEASSWQEIEGGKFCKGVATIEVETTGSYSVASASITDASLMPVVVSYGNKQDLLAQSRLFYSNLLPQRDNPPGIGGHMLLVQFSMLKDKKREDKHVYPPVSLGFFMDGCKKDSVHWHALKKTIDILQLSLDAADKVVYFRVVNKTSQNLTFLFEKGTILEQSVLFGHQHVIVAKDVECKLRGLQECLFKLTYFDMTDLLVPPTKADDMNITPFTIDKTCLASQNKVYAYMNSKIPKE